MMHIDSVNPIVENAVTQYLKKNMNEEEHYNDFESSRYHFKGSGEFFLFGFSTHGFDDIIKNGGREALSAAYKDFFGPKVPSIEGCNVTLGVNRTTLPKKTSNTVHRTLVEIPKGASTEEKEAIKSKNRELEAQKKQIVKAIAQDFALIKKKFIAAPIERALKELKEKGTVPDSMGCQIRYRDSEEYWVIPNKTTVIIVFAMDFKDPVDQGLARILLLEFHEAKKHLKNMKNPPESKYHDLTIPPGLEKYKVDPKKYSNGFLAFTIFKGNVEGKGMEKLLDFLVGFRDYCQYHIHATKAYLHTRMRNKVAGFLKLIQEAKREKSERRTKYKELIGGTTLNVQEDETADKSQLEIIKVKKSK